MALIGEKHMGNTTTPARPAGFDGAMVYNSTHGNLTVAACGGTWYKAGCFYQAPPNIPSCWVIVAGGGSGSGGGGGAGGAILGSTDFSANTWYCVVIGGGGGHGSNGGDGCFAGTFVCGGGRGAGRPVSDGGSGGGGVGNCNDPPRGGGFTVNPSMGNNGGNGTIPYSPGICQNFGGGGGGKGGVATSGGGNTPGGTGGQAGCGGQGIVLDGLLPHPAYANIYPDQNDACCCGLAGGGGGRAQGFAGRGFGKAGGGQGGLDATNGYNGCNGVTNTGGGGGGTNNCPGPATNWANTAGGGVGGSGVLFMFHDREYRVVASTPTITITTDNTSKYTCVLSNGCVSTRVLGGNGCICFELCS